MLGSSAVVDELAARLDAAANERTREWWSRYLKGAIAFRGVPMAGVRKVVHELWRDHDLAALPRDDQLVLTLEFFAQPYAEDKLAGVLALSELLLDQLDATDGDFLAQPFVRGHIGDWSTCDWYCVKVLGRFVARVDEPRVAAEAIAAWRHSPNLWQRRAAAVAFVDLARRRDNPVPGLRELIFEVCAVNAGDPERFSQTSVGWVLRELSHVDPAAVAAFVRAHAEQLSREARNMATAKLPPELRRELNPTGRRR